MGAHGFWRLGDLLHLTLSTDGYLFNLTVCVAEFSMAHPILGKAELRSQDFRGWVRPMQWPGQASGLPLGTDALGRDIARASFTARASRC